jgi:hypothetical protein
MRPRPARGVPGSLPVPPPHLAEAHGSRVRLPPRPFNIYSLIWASEPCARFSIHRCMEESSKSRSLSRLQPRAKSLCAGWCNAAAARQYLYLPTTCYALWIRRPTASFSKSPGESAQEMSSGNCTSMARAPATSVWTLLEPGCLGAFRGRSIRKRNV